MEGADYKVHVIGLAGHIKVDGPDNPEGFDAPKARELAESR